MQLIGVAFYHTGRYITLCIASQEGHLEVVQVLLEYGISANLVNDVSRFSMILYRVAILSVHTCVDDLL